VVPRKVGKIDKIGYEDGYLRSKLLRLLLGRSRNPMEPGIFHKLSLVAFLAWIGLGADGISSSCYGPQEAYLGLQGHYSLAFILAVLTAVTVFVISASYKQIIETFPSGGGSYLVASKLLSPTVGMVAGCALIIDYVLTITVSVASGADAVFSFLPASLYRFKLEAALFILVFLIILNLRGVKESIKPLVPIFLVFIVTHGAVILIALAHHLTELSPLLAKTGKELKLTVNQLGLSGALFLILHAYSMGGGTYTGIEAVSNGIPYLREPKVETGKKTMTYMAVSLAFIAFGLIISYLLLDVEPEAGKTLNAVLFNRALANSWGGRYFVITALISEALILIVAAQTGFLDGPRVLANMALDGWMPSRFSLLSDHLVTKNGIFLMGFAAILLMFTTGGRVRYLVVLYSINVFLTFTLSQLGMVMHWWKVRGTRWRHKLLINGIGFGLTFFILITVVIVKFNEGGWVTLLVTGLLILFSLYIKSHYRQTAKLLARLDHLMLAALPKEVKDNIPKSKDKAPSLRKNTAVLLVNGFSGIGLHTLFTVLRLFPGHFTNFVFIQIGVIDAGRFKGREEIEALNRKVQEDLNKYEKLMHTHGYHAEVFYSLGTDVVHEVEKLALKVKEKYPVNVFFTGQLVFPRETFMTRLLHNYTAFAVQKRLYHKGLPVLILPIKV